MPWQHRSGQSLRPLTPFQCIPRAGQGDVPTPTQPETPVAASTSPVAAPLFPDLGGLLNALKALWDREMLQPTECPSTTRDREHGTGKTEQVPAPRSQSPGPFLHYHSNESSPFSLKPINQETLETNGARAPPVFLPCPPLPHCSPFLLKKDGPWKCFYEPNTIKQKQHRRRFVSLLPSSRVEAGWQWSWISRPSWSCSLGLARSTTQYQFTLKKRLIMLLQLCWLWPVKC